ncbi:hypothetical protein D9M68_811460 [compost metagenome]
MRPVHGLLGLFRQLIIDDSALALIAQEQPLQDEDQGGEAADRDRRVADAHAQRRQCADELVPGGDAQFAAPDDHEQADDRHDDLYQDEDEALP